MLITIFGRPASKKNSKRVFKKYGKTFVLPSKAYEAYKKDAGKQLLQYMRHGLKGKLQINYTFYQKGKLTQDFDNAIGSLNDILQEFNVIENDKNITKGTFEVVNGHSDWRTIIEIIPLQNLI